MCIRREHLPQNWLDEWTDPTPCMLRVTLNINWDARQSNEQFYRKLHSVSDIIKESDW